MNAIFVQGLLWGDEGKGATVDSVTRQTGAKLVVRFNGACQAAHHVVTESGQDHCFSHFGSGTLAGASTHLSRFMSINPISLVNEADHLEELGIDRPLLRITIDPACPVITPYHRAINRLREIARGDSNHGSTGKGVGALASDIAHRRPYVTAVDILGSRDVNRVVDITEHIRQHICNDVPGLMVPPTAEAQILLDVLQQPPTVWLKKIWPLMGQIELAPFTPAQGTTIFEGAQGVLLDEWHGFHPYTTWSNCTFENARQIWGEGGGAFDRIQRIGVTRAYATRHGAGPFPTEYLALKGLLRDEHNKIDRWQGDFRTGHLDLVLLTYALAVVGGVDTLAVTCLDHLETLGCWSAGTHYFPAVHLVPNRDHDLVHQEVITRTLFDTRVEYAHGTNIDDLLSLVETTLKTPIGIVSRGPSAISKDYIGVLA